jgi:hypothetical protein
MMGCADSRGRDPREFEIFFEKIEKLCSGSRLFRSVPVILCSTCMCVCRSRI